MDIRIKTFGLFLTKYSWSFPENGPVPNLRFEHTMMASERAPFKIKTNINVIRPSELKL